MAESPLGVVAEIVFALVQDFLDNARQMGALFVKFLDSMGLVFLSGNIAAFLLAFALMAFVLFLIWKFLFKGWKEIVILLLVGMALLAVLFLA
jgi:large-conductance mechanosensitive channel